MIKVLKICAAVCVFLCILGASCQPENPAKPENPVQPANIATVVGVGDGDSLNVLIDGKQEKIRLASIDAPELNQAFGRAAKKYLSDLVYRKDIRYEVVDKDRYHRFVAIVWVGDKEINLELLKAGYAWNYVQHENQLDPGRRIVYRQAESDARFEGVGLWREAETAVPPWSYRKNKKSNNLWKSNTKN